MHSNCIKSLHNGFCEEELKFELSHPCSQWESDMGSIGMIWVLQSKNYFWLTMVPFWPNISKKFPIISRDFSSHFCKKLILLSSILWTISFDRRSTLLTRCRTLSTLSWTLNLVSWIRNENEIKFTDCPKKKLQSEFQHQYLSKLWIDLKILWDYKTIIWFILVLQTYALYQNVSYRSCSLHR